MRRSDFRFFGLLSILLFGLSASWSYAEDALTVRIQRSEAEKAWTKTVAVSVRYFVKGSDPSGHFWCQQYFESREFEPVSRTETELVYSIPLQVKKTMTCKLPAKILEFRFRGGEGGNQEAGIQLLGADRMWSDAIGSVTQPPLGRDEEVIKFAATADGASFQPSRFLIGYEPLERYPQGITLRVD